MIKINKVFLIGRLTAEPDLKFTPSGTAVCTFNMAVRNPYIKDKDKNTDFFKITVFGKTAENTANNLSKGRLVSVEARLKNNKYQDKSGQTRYTNEIIADTIQYLDKKNNANDQFNQSNQTDYSGYTEVPDDGDIPF